jgi:pilus assembly protein FimV
MLDDLLGNPFILGGAALLLVGAGGFGLYSGYRRRKEKSFGDSIITDSSLKANSLFGSTGGQSVDTNNSVFNSSFAPSASQLDSNEVDPVAEADVYIAYGRDAQAEEILKEALRTQPERNAVRVKLLEIYANRKDVRSFETMASELYGLTKGEGEDWQQAAALGLSIDPKNPLYASGKGGSDATTQQHTSAGHTLPLDDSGLDELVRETHSHPSMNSPNTLEESPYFGSSTLGGLEPDTVARHPESQPKLGGNTNLDFDLDGIDHEPEAPKAAAPAAHAAPVVEPKADLANIDFDFLDEEKPTELGAEQAAHHLEAQLAEAHPSDFPSLATPTAAPKAVEHAPVEVPSLPEVAAKAAEHVPMHEPAEEKTQLLDFDLSGITLELDKGAKGAAAAAKAEEHHALDLNVPEIPAMDFHVPEVPVAEVKLPEAKAPEIHEPKLEVPDLHALDLHVPEIHHAVETAPAPIHHAEPSLDAVPDLIAHGHHEAEVALDTGVDHDYSSSAEMATKLDLAVAYTEIGDKEGARELLEEVIQAGASEHSDKAKALLAKLG